MQKKQDKQLDCSICSGQAPSILPENFDAWRLWLNVSTQWRAGGFQIVGLDYPAVFKIAEILYIDVTPDLFLKLRELEKYELDRLRKEADRNGERSANNR